MYSCDQLWTCILLQCSPTRYVTPVPRRSEHWMTQKVQMWTKQRPFPTLGDFAILLRIHQGERPDRPSLAECHGVEPSDAAWKYVEKCWSQDPTLRPPMKDIADYFAIQNVEPSPQPLFRGMASSTRMACGNATIALMRSSSEAATGRATSFDKTTFVSVEEIHGVEAGPFPSFPSAIIRTESSRSDQMSHALLHSLLLPPESRPALDTHMPALGIGSGRSVPTLQAIRSWLAGTNSSNAEQLVFADDGESEDEMTLTSTRKSAGRRLSDPTSMADASLFTSSTRSSRTVSTGSLYLA